MSSKKNDQMKGKEEKNVPEEDKNLPAAQRRTVTDDTQTKKEQSKASSSEQSKKVKKNQPKDDSQPKRSSLLEDVPFYQQNPYPSKYGIPRFGGGGLGSGSLGPVIPGMPEGTFPRIGGSDLDPFAHPKSGGMLFDPFQPGQVPSRPPRPDNLPPGARYDPTSAFDPRRGPRPPNPDHAKMPDRDWNDPFI